MDIIPLIILGAIVWFVAICIERNDQVQAARQERKRLYDQHMPTPDLPPYKPKCALHAFNSAEAARYVGVSCTVCGGVSIALTRAGL